MYYLVVCEPFPLNKMAVFFFFRINLSVWVGLEPNNAAASGIGRHWWTALRHLVCPVCSVPYPLVRVCYSDRFMWLAGVFICLALWLRPFHDVHYSRVIIIISEMDCWLGTWACLEYEYALFGTTDVYRILCHLLVVIVKKKKNLLHFIVTRHSLFSLLFTNPNENKLLIFPHQYVHYRRYLQVVQINFVID